MIYYVEKNSFIAVPHEVHSAYCSKLPPSQNRIFLGDYHNSQNAITEAKKIFTRAIACAACCDLHNKQG